MKTHIGSLQKKGDRYYLVLWEGKRQRWIALKTDKLSLARLRAAKIAPRDPDDEAAWLSQLVREGEWARQRLAKRRAQRELTWDNLAEVSEPIVDQDATDENRACHAHWISLIARQAQKTKTGERPGLLSEEDARLVVHELACVYLSISRIVAYLRRVWVTLGLGSGIWPEGRIAANLSQRKLAEHYRRLSAAEVSRLYAYSREHSQPLADMILLGYSTGLRLSDVAELDVSEVSLPFLRVCPNKTRRHKPIPLKIPLTAAAQETVRRLNEAAVVKGNWYLFDEFSRKRPSRKIVPLFRECGIFKQGTGRASFHSLRATFISLMDDAGVPPHVTDAITGHGGGGMHARYTQPSDEALLSAVSKAIPDLATLPFGCQI